MTRFIATREFEVTDGKHCFAYGEVRYTFTVTPGRKAVTWATATGGFAPAEAATVDVTGVESRLHKSHDWTPADGALGDILREVPDAWFLAKANEQAEASA